MTRIYLAGPINGKTDSECREWREYAKSAAAGVLFLDPMSRDYRGVELANVAEIVEGDKEDILSCSAVLVMAETPSWGTAMEILFAHSAKIPVFVICSKTSPSPWLIYHASVYKTIDEALVAILGNDND